MLNLQSVKTSLKYAVCSVFENVPIFPKHKMDGETCVLDVRTVEVKGQKKKEATAYR
jgi:hypothetical protein